MLNDNSSLEGASDVRPKPPGQTLNRACEGCRLLKIRCVPVGLAASPICQRCQRSGRMCVYAPVQRRRRRKRTDTRMTELEMELKAMRSQLYGGDGHLTQNVSQTRSIPISIASRELASDSEAYKDPPSSSTDGQSSEGRDISRQTSYQMEQTQTINEGATSLSRPMPTMTFSDGTMPVFFSSYTAVTLFESFNKDLVLHYPGVTFPDYCSPEQARRIKPTLFQAAVTAAACQTDGDLFAELFNGVIKYLGEQIFIEGEKSLELVQALTLTAIWYCPPEKEYGHARLQFYQYLHMAATMAVELGIGMKLDATIRSLEESRTLLSCYICCAGVAKRLRRPNMLRWSNMMAGCLEVLENSQFSKLPDKRLAAWVKLQNIVDEWNSDSLNESRNELALKGFEKQLEMWKSNLEPGVLNSALTMAYHQDRIQFYESALEGGTTILLDFSYKHFDPSRMLQPPQVQSPMSAAQVNAVVACIESSHALLDEFLTFDIPTLQLIPVILYVRLSYAIVVLIKMYYSLTWPGSELAKIMDAQTLKLDFYMDKVIKSLTAAAGPKNLRVPKKWLSMVSGIDVWYRRIVAVRRKEEKANSQGAIIRTKETTDETSSIEARAEEPKTTYKAYQSRNLATSTLPYSALQQQTSFPLDPDGNILVDAHNLHTASAQKNWPLSTDVQATAITSTAPPHLLSTTTSPTYNPADMDFAPTTTFFSANDTTMDFMTGDFAGWAQDAELLNGMDSVDGVDYGDYENYIEDEGDGIEQHINGNWS